MRKYPNCLILYLCALMLPVHSSAFAADSLWGKRWIHGSEDCDLNTDPALETYAVSDNTYVLRQNKCVSYEAPFMYLLIGEEQALLLDTGATADEALFPLYKIVRLLTGDKKLVVLHSHGHRDHRSADGQFSAHPAVDVVGVEYDSLQAYFGFSRWPVEELGLQLGDRQLQVIPTPGHQEEAIAVYDSQTGWLLTGDTLYPGRIYVKDWQAYRDSIARLSAFAQRYPVTALLGGHIEMNAASGEIYPIGTRYQPQEAPLPLPPSVLPELDAVLQATEQPAELNLAGISIMPMNGLQRGLSNMARWLSR